MVGSAYCVSEQSYGLHVVTGLPVHLYTPEHARQVEMALLGSYVFRLNGQERAMVDGTPASMTSMPGGWKNTKSRYGTAP